MRYQAPPVASLMSTFVPETAEPLMNLDFQGNSVLSIVETSACGATAEPVIPMATQLSNAISGKKLSKAGFTPPAEAPGS
jgi:hypothetical protein